MITFLLVACSCGEETQSGSGGGSGGAISGGGGGGMDRGGAGGASGVGGDAEAGTPFDCKHAEVVEDCTAGWCRIPAGCFVIGSPKNEWGRGAYSENQLKVTLTHAFLIQQKETTQAEWTALGLPNPSTPPAEPGFSGDCISPQCPVGNVNWFEAAAFANMLSEKDGFQPCYLLEGCTGQVGAGMTCPSIKTTSATYYECEGYRLPGEVEWEYAARAGTMSAFYTGSIAETGTDPFACANDDNLAKVGWYCVNSGDITHPGTQKLKNG